MSAALKLRVVAEDEDHTVIVEPTASEWEVDTVAIKVLFWDNEEWTRLPKVARPKDAQSHRGKGWILVLPI